jgi:peroxiredoxin
LRRWEELRPELDARGVRIVTVSPDTPERIRTQRVKHGLRAIMLADPEGALIERLGIRNRGIHSGPPGGPRLPIPTTVLVDAAGIVRWIDQSEHYQRRSDPARVRRALDEHLN